MAEGTIAGRSDAALFVAAVPAVMDGGFCVDKAAVAAMAAFSGSVADAHVEAGFAVGFQSLVAGVVEIDGQLALAGHANVRRSGFGKKQRYRSEQQVEAEEQWQDTLHFFERLKDTWAGHSASGP
jgi:hypothetical protein